ncbi:MAG TPA: hypothetical protein VNN72_06930 [Polyangiaceae bacterium]|nr:hypothetical protein [Polyangiaceae bacterium]
MTVMRKQLAAAGALALASLVTSACGSSSGDDDASTGATGAVLGGTSGSGGNIAAQGGSGNASAGKGGTANTAGGTGGNSAAGRGGTSSDAGRGGASTAGSGGTGKGGSGGTSSGTPGPLGAACNVDGDCAKNLTCITSDSDTLGTFGPAGGLCTMECTDHPDCTALTPGAYCVAFDEAGTIAFCLEGCTPGTAGEPKCQERPDMGCNLVGLEDSSTECETSDDCGSGQLCNPDTSRCGAVITACNPTCAGDFDCPGERHCDFSSGMCADGPADGLPFGSQCDTSAATDPCNGFCVATSVTGTDGMCMGICSLNADLVGCGWDGTGDADAACLFQTRLSQEDDVGTGDIMICGALCDCNDDCAGDGVYCISEDTGTLEAIWGRLGYCRPLTEGETVAKNTVACE